jgi:fumarylacetoacetate (FAA) hydrolase
VNLAAGAIIGSGTVSNRGEDGGPGKPVSEGGRGYSCIAEQRMIETIQSGKTSTTPFLKHGDRVEIEMRDATRSLDLRTDRAGSGQDLGAELRWRG